MDAVNKLSSCPGWMRVNQEERDAAMLRLEICMSIDACGRGNTVRCVDGWAQKLVGRHGFSRFNIRHFYYRCWRGSNRSPSHLILYETLRKGNAPPLESYGLTREKVHRYFRDVGITAKRWEVDRGFRGHALARALHDVERTNMCARVLAVLAAEVNKHDQSLVKRLLQLRDRRAAIEKDIRRLERRLVQRHINYVT